MKKLLTLMLVLGMGSAANAALFLSVDGDTSQDEIDLFEYDTAVIGIYNTDGGIYPAYMEISRISEGGFAMSNPQLTALAGDISEFTGPFDVDDCKWIEVLLCQRTGMSTPGIQFTWDLTCLKANVDVFVELYDSTYSLFDSLTIHQVPEPMTLAFLALGGLLALRRRR